MTSLTPRQQIFGLAGWLLICFIAAGIGAMASIRAEEFYSQLTRPDWAPPGSVFGPVWSCLYTLMAIAAWLVWRIGGFSLARPALVLFLVQLVFNSLWSWLFFGWQLPGWALVEVILLWLLILATVIAFWRVRPLAGILLLPYLLWVSFASALNHTLWQLNPALSG